MRVDDRYQHYPKGNHYPPRWPDADPIEPMWPATLDCGCKIHFPEPLPRVGSALYCRLHGHARVHGVAEPPAKLAGPHVMTGKRCSAIKSDGEQCGRFVGPDTAVCVMHARRP